MNKYLDFLCTFGFNQSRFMRSVFLKQRHWMTFIFLIFFVAHVPSCLSYKVLCFEIDGRISIENIQSNANCLPYGSLSLSSPQYIDEIGASNKSCECGPCVDIHFDDHKQKISSSRQGKSFMTNHLPTYEPIKTYIETDNAR